MAISSRTQDSLFKALKHSLEASLGELITSDQAFVPLSDKELSKYDMTRIALTVSGINFKFIVLLHYCTEKVYQLYFSDSANNDSMSGEANLEHYFLEAGNRYCGEIKRLLYKMFDYLGMSTPCQLSKTTTLNDMRDKNLQGEFHIGVLQGDVAVLGGSLYFFTEADIDSAIEASVFQEESSAGELEFF